MATVNQNQNEVAWNLRKQLALAVRSIQWSYAIFWSISVTQPGNLEWGDGYYNGEIKTRKTTVVEDVDQLNGEDELGLNRSDELRELYESLRLGTESETNPQSAAKRPTAALSPEDLTDAEWYFLICMSFVFSIGQGLPGSTLAKNQTCWLCNAHRADTKVFSRSLLAKLASFQTVACFPHLGGVVELGSTELVPEDPDLIRRIKTSFLRSPTSVLNHFSYNITNNNSLVGEASNMPGNGLDRLEDCPDVDIYSPNCSSDNNFADNVLREEMSLIEAFNVEVSQMQSWPFLDDDAISNCLNNSVNSSHCVSQTHGNTESFVPLLDGNGTNEHCTNDAQECNQQQKQDSTGVQGDDIHYQIVLSNLLKSSQQLILGPYFTNGNSGSSFVCWKKGGLFSRTNVPQTGVPQKLLKKVVCEVAKVQENCRLESRKRKDKKEGLSKPAVDEIDRNHMLSKRKRREKMNERFMILGSLVPSSGKADKVSVLDHTIEYLQELERKIEELQSNKEGMEQGESTSQIKPRNAIESSDNYGRNRVCINKPSMNKRKACQTDKNGGEHGKVRLRDSLTDNISVDIRDKDVSIDISCPWRERVIHEVMEAISKLHLVSETVQSSNADGMFYMTIRAKCKGLKAAPASKIRLALQKVMRKP